MWELEPHLQSKQQASICTTSFLQFPAGFHKQLHSIYHTGKELFVSGNPFHNKVFLSPQQNHNMKVYILPAVIEFGSNMHMVPLQNPFSILVCHTEVCFIQIPW